jgi:hypothetical protein
MKTGTQVRMRAHAGTVAWREKTDVSPPEGIGSAFELLIGCPRQMQTASDHADFVAAGQRCNVIERIHNTGVRTPGY